MQSLFTNSEAQVCSGQLKAPLGTAL